MKLTWYNKIGNTYDLKLGEGLFLHVSDNAMCVTMKPMKSLLMWVTQMDEKKKK